MHRRSTALPLNRKAALPDRHAHLHRTLLVSPLLPRRGMVSSHPAIVHSIYIVAQLLYWYLCKRENERRDRLVAEGHPDALPRPASEEDNRTDLQDLAFRYVL